MCATPTKTNHNACTESHNAPSSTRVALQTQHALMPTPHHTPPCTAQAVNGAARQPALLSTPHAALASAAAALAAATDVPHAAACAALTRQPDLMHVRPRHLAALCDALAAALGLSGSAGGQMPQHSPQHSPPAKSHSARGEALQVLTRLPPRAWEQLTGPPDEARAALHMRVVELGHLVGCGGASIAAAMAARAPILLVLPLPQVSDSWAVVKEVMGAGGAPTARVLAAVGRAPGLLAVPACELRASARALSAALGLTPQHLARVALQQPGVLKCGPGEVQVRAKGGVRGRGGGVAGCWVRGCMLPGGGRAWCWVGGAKRTWVGVGVCGSR